MIIIKFYKFITPENGVTSESNIEIEHVVSCQSYECYKRSSENIAIMVYKGFTTQDGVEYRITTNERDYDGCYVENFNGKTINRYHAEPLGMEACHG